MRNFLMEAKMLIKQTLKRATSRLARAFFTCTLSLSAMLGAMPLSTSVLAQTESEQDWWFTVEMIVFKRDLLPSNTEDFSKADFVMTDTTALDVFSLPLLNRHRLHFYIEQLPLCHLGSDADASSVEAPALDAQQEQQSIFSFLRSLPTQLTFLSDSELSSNKAPSEITPSAITPSEIAPSEFTEPSIELLDENLLFDYLKRSAVDIDELPQQTELAQLQAEADSAQMALNQASSQNTADQQDSEKQTLALELSSSALLPQPFGFEAANQNQQANSFMCAQHNENANEYAKQLQNFSTEIFAEQTVFTDHHRLIAKEDTYLTDYAQKVFRQRDIKPLLHTAWRQEVVFGEENAEFYRIKAGDELRIEPVFDYASAMQSYIKRHSALTDIDPSENNLALFDDLADALAKQQAVDWLAQEPPSSEALEAEFEVQQERELDGLFKVYLDYVNQVPYLHVDTEFKHYKISMDKNGLGQIDVFPFKQRRRIISKQIHYFDHPAFGVLIRLERFTPPLKDSVEL